MDESTSLYFQLFWKSKSYNLLTENHTVIQ